jgi:hypothetical protein
MNSDLLIVYNVLCDWEHEDMTAEEIETSVNSTIQNRKE